MNIKKLIISALAVCTIGSAAISPASATLTGRANCGSVGCYNSKTSTVKGKYAKATVKYTGKNTGIINWESTGTASVKNLGSFDSRYGSTFAKNGALWGVKKNGGYTQLGLDSYFRKGETINGSKFVTYHNGLKYKGVEAEIWSEYGRTTYCQYFNLTLTR